MTKIDTKETAVSTVKSLFSIVPFAGGALNEIFFDYRSRVKQNRINNFTELLSEFFINNPQIAPETLKTEEFSDLFESVIRRVVLTKSKEKHIRFRDILSQQIINPHQDVENSETYLDLISTLDETAIKILGEHYLFFKKYSDIDPLRKVASDRIFSKQEDINKVNTTFPRDEAKAEQLKADLTESQKVVDQYNKQITAIQDFRKAEHYQISTSEFLYYKQTLFSKGLLIDKGFGTHGGSESFRYMWITEFGQRFLQFLLSN